MKKQIVRLVGLSFLSLNLFAQSAQALRFDRNVPQDVQQKLNEDLTLIATLEGQNESALHRQIFGPISGSTYDQFFRSRITSVGMDRCGGGAAVACVMPFMNPNKMWLTPNYVRFNQPQMARLMVAFHEARHSESQNGNWSHATCPRPFRDANGNDRKSIWTGEKLEGQPGCDQTAKGSYGMTVVMLKNIAKKCTNCSSKTTMDAELYGSDQFDRIINARAREEMVADLQ